MANVRCAVIGVGAVGARHARLLAARSDTDLLVCCDTDPTVADRIPAGARYTGDLEVALSTPGLEAVLVCTPADTHLAICAMAVERDLAVFSEKPITATVDESRELRALLDGAVRPLVVGHMLRFDPDYAGLREQIRAGAIGELVQLSARRMIPAYEGRDIAGRTSLALEVAVHDIDVLRWIAGDVTRVFAEGTRLRESPPGQVDAIAATLRFSSGVIATLELNWTMAGRGADAVDFRLKAFGSEGALEIDGTGAEPDDADTLLTAEHDRFLALARGDGTWPVSLEEAELTLEAALAVNASMAAALPITLSGVRTSP